jgi:hypothetical protein
MVFAMKAKLGTVDDGWRTPDAKLFALSQIQQFFAFLVSVGYRLFTPYIPVRTQGLLVEPAVFLHVVRLTSRSNSGPSSIRSM